MVVTRRIGQRNSPAVAAVHARQRSIRPGPVDLAVSTPTLTLMANTSIDWSQFWYPGRKSAFTADEMARAGSDKPSPTLLAVAAFNYATVAFVVLQVAPATQTARLAAALVGMAILGLGAARWLWWRPWRRPLMQAQFALMAMTLLMALGVRWRVPLDTDREAVLIALVISGALLVGALWFLVAWRAHQIEARLREQAEREKAIEMARRLAAAQIEPHFLFNTLASVQHWVQTKDDRAAPLLAALIGYMRATLPMFGRTLLAVGEELLAVERYLQVMQARMGQRLAWRIEVDETLHGVQLPPGVLLTLVENAVVHGLEPRLAGGELRVRGYADQAVPRFEVVDNGPGPQPDMQEGVGLSNIRQRLALTSGAAARLNLGAAAGGGFRAEVQLPLKTATT
jgi:signal transduction histidine kinase